MEIFILLLAEARGNSQNLTHDQSRSIPKFGRPKTRPEIEGHIVFIF